MEINSHPHIFRDGSHFQYAVDLYSFDSELRSLLYSALQHIEVAVRAKVGQYFASAYGPFWFMDKSIALNEDLFHQNLEVLRNEVLRSHDDFILEHFRKYDSPEMPPSWKTLEFASFGTLSKLYKNLKDYKILKQVARDFKIPQHEYLRNWLEGLTVVRNRCAHHARVWNASFAVRPKITHGMRKKWISNLEFPHNRLYAQLCCISYMLNSIIRDNSFVSDFKNLLKKYPNIEISAMGIPSGWENEPLWC